MGRRAKLQILSLLLVAFLTLVASALARHAIHHRTHANSVVATTACTAASGNSVTFSWSKFANPAGSGNGGGNTPGWKIVYTPSGGSPITLSGTASFPLDSYALTVPIPNAPGFVVASSDWTSSQTTDGSAAGHYSKVFHVPHCTAKPAIATTASPSVAVGGMISDTAVLSDGRSPTGKITFNLYSATDTTCSTALSTSTVSVNGNGTYVSDSVTEETAGTYQWTASYSGDANNAPTGPEGCGVHAEQVTVFSHLASPSIVTTASPSVAVGGMISDTAVLSGGSSPTGTITFKLYAVTDTTCSAPLSTSTVSVNGNGSYDATAVIEETAGTYQWTASYSGDPNNYPTAAEGCGVKAEQVTVIPHPTPSIVTTASPGTVVGGMISDTATLNGGSSPTGTITFNLYAVTDTSCSTALVTRLVGVNGNATYVSPPVAADKAGTYQWTASYSGDANNASAAEGCGPKLAEQVVVTQMTPTIKTTAVPGGICTLPVSKSPPCRLADKAMLGGGSSPTGTITFHLYLESDTTCSRPLHTTATVPVNGDRTYLSPVVSETGVQHYQWNATYSGDTNNTSVVGACNDHKERIQVKAHPKPFAACKLAPTISAGFVDARTTYMVRVQVARQARVQRVTFYLDNQQQMTVTKPTARSFSYAVRRPLNYPAGRHTVRAVVKAKPKKCGGTVQASFESPPPVCTSFCGGVRQVASSEIAMVERRVRIRRRA